MNKFAVLAASLVASFALAFAVYSAESNPNNSAFPRVVAKVRLTNLTQPIPSTTILNVPRTGLYRVSSYMAMTMPVTNSQDSWCLFLNWTDEVGVESNQFSGLLLSNVPPIDYATSFYGNFQPPLPIEAIAGTPITYYTFGPTDGSGGTYELFITVEQVQ
jgi:hypothetical protein